MRATARSWPHCSGGRATSGFPVLLLAASGGVRLHEANPAELALARALQELLATRAAGLPVFAVATGDVFGGMSVLACACDRLALLPGIRFGLSGPGVIETAHGRHDLDAADPAVVEALFGARARVAAGAAELLGDDADLIGAWFERAAREPVDFAARVAAMHLRLGARLPATAVATEAAFAPGLEVREGRLWLPAVGGTLSAVAAHALTSALLSAPPAAREVLIAEDSQGHEVSRAAEKVVLSQYLAHHAAAIALLRARGVRIIGVLEGVGHSAAFFANALQADVVYARPQARVVAIEPAALAHVTRLDPAVVAARVEDDPLLGQPVRHFAALGGATLVTAEALIG